MFTRVLFSLACVALAVCSAAPDLQTLPVVNDKNSLYKCKDKTTEGGVYNSKLEFEKQFGFKEQSLSIDIPTMHWNPKSKRDEKLVSLLVSACSYFNQKYLVLASYIGSQFNGRVIVEHLDKPKLFPLDIKVNAYYYGADGRLLNSTLIGLITNE